MCTHYICILILMTNIIILLLHDKAIACHVMHGNNFIIFIIHHHVPNVYNLDNFQGYVWESQILREQLNSQSSLPIIGHCYRIPDMKFQVSAVRIMDMVGHMQKNSVFSATSFGLRVELDSNHPPFVSGKDRGRCARGGRG